VGATVLLAFALTVMPLPHWAEMWRPAWAALVLSYWCIALPHRIGIAAGWCTGVLLDVLTGSLLGQHALGLSVVAFLAHRFHQRIRVLPPWQQALSVLPMVFAYQALVFWIKGVRGIPVEGWAYLTGPLTSVVVWPWLFIVLRDIRRKFSIA